MSWGTKPFKRAALLVAALSLVAAAASGGSTSASSSGGDQPAGADRQALPWESTVAPGDRLPEFEAEELDGETVHVTYEEGDTVLLFFLSACPDCHAMIPSWSEAYLNRPEGLRVIGVMLDREGPDFFERLPVEFPVVRARQHWWWKWGVREVPLTVRVGADGVVTDSVQGKVDTKTLARFFRE